MAVARGGRLVFQGVSFRLGAGEALAVVGPNGAGKSTLLRALAGWLPPRHGTVRLHGLGDGLSLAEATHYLGHQDGLKPGLTAGENLAVAAGLLGSPGVPQADARHADPEAALGRLGLAALVDLPAAYLSAGQRRRVALARLLIAPRPLWLLDEPVTALDAGAQATLQALMETHLEEGGLIVAATHGPLALPRVAELRLDA